MKRTWKRRNLTREERAEYYSKLQPCECGSKNLKRHTSKKKDGPTDEKTRFFRCLDCGKRVKQTFSIQQNPLKGDIWQA